ncbi:hypothetical protein ACIOKD_41625 [Streptomyces sp. NPDC087844]|uniref:hypothetical protein n=1 Tax=Streptomyces sp. NPDC087844 TaxID=3365805 RepID=UPI00382F0B68
MLSAGTTATGAVLRAELLRAAHTARLAGLHRAEAAALDVVRALPGPDDPHRGRDRAGQVAALRELLLVTHRARAADPDPALIGAGARNHRPDGPLRLYGVCREPVIGPGGPGGPDGPGGVITHLVDDDGRWYTLPDVRPGGPARARRAGTAHVALRSFLSDHFRLSRGGLTVFGAVVSPEGRLLPEPGVRATFTAGRPGLARAGRADVPDPAEPADRSLTVCDVEIAGTDGEDVLVRVLPHPGDLDAGDRADPGAPVRLAPVHPDPAPAHTANLRRLGARPGLRIRVLGRVDALRGTVLRPLTVGPVPGAEATLRLPADWHDRADLGYDDLRDGHFPPSPPAHDESPALHLACRLRCPRRPRRLTSLAGPPPGRAGGRGRPPGRRRTRTGRRPPRPGGGPAPGRLRHRRGPPRPAGTGGRPPLPRRLRPPARGRHRAVHDLVAGRGRLPRDLAGGNGIHRTTVTRWVREVVGLLAARAARLARAWTAP